MTAKPLARLVPLTAPEGETKAEFWERKAKERAKEIGRLRNKLALLQLELEELAREVGE